MATHKKARPERTPHKENLAVPLDVRLLRQMETWFKRLADPRCADSVNLGVAPRFARALEQVLTDHHLAMQDRVQAQARAIIDAAPSVHALPGPAAGEPAPALALEVVR